MPNLGARFPITIDYYRAGSTQPTAMPGAYINGDVEASENLTDGFRPVQQYDRSYRLINFKKDGNPSSIYTWSGGSTLRDDGGSPTQLCNVPTW
jgi:hypothetical protein